jgi:hypothetical protein
VHFLAIFLSECTKAAGCLSALNLGLWVKRPDEALHYDIPLKIGSISIRAMVACPTIYGFIGMWAVDPRHKAQDVIHWLQFIHTACPHWYLKLECHRSLLEDRTLHLHQWFEHEIETYRTLQCLLHFLNSLMFLINGNIAHMLRYSHCTRDLPFPELFPTLLSSPLINERAPLVPDSIIVLNVA